MVNFFENLMLIRFAAGVLLGTVIILFICRLLLIGFSKIGHVYLCIRISVVTSILLIRGTNSD